MKVKMDFDKYTKIIDDLQKFPQKLKVLHFIGMGEPLLHPRIADMVRYAKEKDVAESIDIVTNGSLLTPKLSAQLIEAGLDRLRISLQGMDEKKYKETSNVEIDFLKLKENIKWFYEHRKNTKVYVKIINIALGQYTKEDFYKEFQFVADDMAVEYLSPLFSEVDYENVLKDNKKNKYMHSMRGNTIKQAQVCPQPFYSLQITPDGDCMPCCVVDESTDIGNCFTNSLESIWNGKKLKDFRIKHLQREKNNIIACKNCSLYQYLMFPEDFLDDDLEMLLNKFF